jgi:hypothetical protein
MARSPRVPWKRQNPRKRAGQATKHLTAAEKSAAKARAKRAGRHYPNLVDNMAAAAKKGAKTKTSGRKRAAKASTSRSASKQTTARKSNKPAGTRKHAGRKSAKAPAKQKT